MSLNNEISWKRDSPFNFKSAKLANVRGKVNKYLPPMANTIARKKRTIIRSILVPLEIFFEEIVVNFFNKK